MAVVSKIKQIVSSNPSTPSKIDSDNIQDIDYDVNYEEEKIQQLIIKGNFVQNQCYWIKIGMPQDINYDLNYGVRLMNFTDTTGDLKNIQDYQFVKYISIPKYRVSTSDNSIVWHYQDINSKAINAAVAIKVTDISTIETLYTTASQRANKMFYTEDANTQQITSIYQYDHEGNKINVDLKNQITFKALNLINNFANDQNVEDRMAWREFLICPDATYNTIYLYLRPIADDSNMIWNKHVNNQNIEMIGRHVNLTDITVWCAELSTNLVSNINGTVNNIGIWGRSEQLIAVNGQELSIGPSGYYELKGFTINSLYIVNIAADDKYTLDIQYTTTN